MTDTPESTTLEVRQAFSTTEKLGFVALLVLLSLLFQQVDMKITAALSFKYLNGHFLDFYDLSKSEYLPTIYVICAIWNIPLRLMGLNIVSEHDIGLSIFWMKLLPLLFAYLSLRQFIALCSELGMNRAQAGWSALVWVTSPLLLFGVVLLGQHDIISVFLMLWALRVYRRGHLFHFAAIMGVAVTLKYFPFFVYLPLLLLVEKRPLRLALNGLLFVIPYILVVLPYLSSPAFKTDALSRTIVHRVFTMGTPYIYDIKLSFFVLIWALLCGFAYFHRFREKDRDAWTIYVCLAALTALLGLVFWHPQWLILITPFIALVTVRHARPAFFLAIETALFFFFVAFSTDFWFENVDEKMLEHGILGATGLLTRINPLLTDDLGALTMHNLFKALDPSLSISCVTAALLLIFYFAYPRRRDARHGWERGIAALQTERGYLRLRCYGGLSFFVVPALICLFTPSDGAMVQSTVLVDGGGTPVADESLVLEEPTSITQVFTPTCSRINSLHFLARRVDESTNEAIRVEIRDPQGTVIFQKYVFLSDMQMGSHMLNVLRGSYLPVRLGGIPVTPGSMYRCTLTSCGPPSVKLLKLYVTEGNTAKSDCRLLIHDVPQDRSLAFKLYGT